MDQYEKLKLEITDLNTLNEEQANLITELTEENEKLKHWNEWLESTRVYNFYFGKEVVQKFCVTDEVYNQITKQVCDAVYKLTRELMAFGYDTVKIKDVETVLEQFDRGE